MNATGSLSWKTCRAGRAMNRSRSDGSVSQRMTRRQNSGAGGATTPEVRIAKSHRQNPRPVKTATRPPSVLARAKSGTLRFGWANSADRSVVAAGDTLYCPSRTHTGGSRFHRASRSPADSLTPVSSWVRPASVISAELTVYPQRRSA